MSNQAIAAKNIVKHYNANGESLEILKGVNFSINKGTFVAIVGPSGSGKTTLLNLICGLDTDYEGSLNVGGQQLKGMKEKALSKWRAHNIGIVFQSHHLIPELTASDNIEIPLHLSPLKKPQRREKVSAALALVGLRDRESHTPKQLSGGEQQRVGIARAIVNGNDIIVCDEPTGSLNQEKSQHLVVLLQSLCRDYQKTLVMVTHDMTMACHADRVLRLDNGILHEEEQ